MGDVIIRIGHVAAISRIVLPGDILPFQVFPGDAVEIIDVNIDVVAVVLIAPTAAMIVIIVMMIVVIPIDIAENGISGGDAQAVTKTVNEAVGELLPRRWRQVDRWGGRIRAVAAVNDRWVVIRHVHYFRIR